MMAVQASHPPWTQSMPAPFFFDASIEMYHEDLLKYSNLFAIVVSPANLSCKSATVIWGSPSCWSTKYRLCSRARFLMIMLCTQTSTPCVCKIFHLGTTTSVRPLMKKYRFLDGSHYNPPFLMGTGRNAMVKSKEGELWCWCSIQSQPGITGLWPTCSDAILHHFQDQISVGSLLTVFALEHPHLVQVKNSDTVSSSSSTTPAFNCSGWTLIIFMLGFLNSPAFATHHPLASFQGEHHQWLSILSQDGGFYSCAAPQCLDSEVLVCVSSLSYPTPMISLCGDVEGLAGSEQPEGMLCSVLLGHPHASAYAHGRCSLAISICSASVRPDSSSGIILDVLFSWDHNFGICLFFYIEHNNCSL